MADTAAQRAIRAMDLVPYILENPGVSTNELASKFSVSQKQIEKDLQLIFLCGLPGYTPYELIDLTFEDGVVSIIEPQVLTKPRNFSSTELVVIKLGLEILKEINKNDFEKSAKLNALLEKIDDKSTQGSILLAQQITSSPFYSVISSAISQRRLLDIEYKSLSKDSLSQRNVMPVSLSMLNGKVYLLAYDMDRKAERTFKLELISKCHIGKTAPEETLAADQNVHIVDLIVDKTLKNFLERNNSIIIQQQFKAEGVLVSLKVSNLEWISRAILSFAPRIKVVAPESLVSLVKERANDVIKAYSKLNRN